MTDHMHDGSGIDCPDCEIRKHMLDHHGWTLDAEGFASMDTATVTMSHNEDHADPDQNFGHTHKIESICTVCELTWDHYPEGDEEYGCTQEVEGVNGQILTPHNYIDPVEFVNQLIEWGQLERARDLLTRLIEAE